MTRGGRAAVAAGCAVLLTSPLWGVRLLRRVPGFEIERVEIRGAELLTAREVLAASEIREGESIWDDDGRWVAALRSHLVIATASIARRPPSTLRIHVVEETPVALVQDGVLRPATAAGEMLPVDPARVPMDLPLIRGARGGTTPDGAEEPAIRMLLGEIGRLQRLDSGLVGRISEARIDEAGDMVLTLTQPAVELLLSPGAGPDRLRQLNAVLADLERRRRSRGQNGAEHVTPERIDLRFEDQIVVRFSFN